MKITMPTHRCRKSVPFYTRVPSFASSMATAWSLAHPTTPFLTDHVLQKLYKRVNQDGGGWGGG